MILVDTGPLVALFDPADSDHARCVDILAGVDDRLITTIPVLTEAFHLLDPASAGSRALMEFVARGGLDVEFLDELLMQRAFQLMAQYADQPMDLADASLVALAEGLNERKVFTIDHRDFTVYRARVGHRHLPFEVID